LAKLPDILAFIAIGCIALAFVAWLTSRGRPPLSIPPVLRRVRLFRTSAAATLLLAAVLISAIAAVMAVVVRFMG
jgi:hypothetical protein